MWTHHDDGDQSPGAPPDAKPEATAEGKPEATAEAMAEATTEAAVETSAEATAPAPEPPALSLTPKPVPVSQAIPQGFRSLAVPDVGETASARDRIPAVPRLILPDPPMCLTRMPLAQSAQLPPQLDACGFELDVLAPQLGSGAYAAVRKLRHRKTGREMALKIVEKQPLEIRQMLPQMQRELGIQGALRHKHLLRLMSIVEDDRYIYMLLEFCGGGTLRSLCQAQPAKRLAEPDAARLIFQILQGVDHMHSHGFVHRDLKADNILLSLPEFDVRICDFGWSAEATLDKLLLTTCGTPEFWAPEQWSRAPQSYSTDCWALGCLFYEVLVGHPPFWGSHEEIKEKVLVGDARYPPFLSQAAMSLLHCHLQVEPQHRAPCSWSMQKHEFLEDERQRASSSASDLSTKSGSGPSDEELEELSGAFAPAADAS